MASPRQSRPFGAGLGEVSLGRPFGVPVTVSLGGTGLIMLLVAISLAPVVRSVVPGADQTTGLLVGAVGGVLLQLSVLVHEISHCIVARMLGLTVRGLHLRLIAGITEIEGEFEDPGREYLVAMAGPLATVALAGLGGVGYCLSAVPASHNPYSSSGGVLDVLVIFFVLSNLALAAFNLLPGMPLDGGRVLRSAVWAVTGRVWTGTYVAAWVGQAIAVVTVAYGISEALSSTGRNEGFVTVLAGLYVATNAANALRQARLEKVTPLLDAQTLLRRCITVGKDLPLAEALRRAHEVGATAAVVTDAAGRPEMVVRGALVDQVPENRRPWVPVSSVSTAIGAGMVLDVALTGALLLEAMQTRPASEYVVVGAGAGVLGVLVTVDVAKLVVPGRYRPGGAFSG